MHQDLFRHIAQNVDLAASSIRYKPIGGGSINQAFLLDDGLRKCFVKINSRSRFPGMFEAEEKGLNLLRSCDAFLVPQVFGIFHEGDDAALAMEYLPQGQKDASFSERFAHALVQLHQESEDYFGLDHDNYIGSLAQSNEKLSKWTDFFIQQRLQPQIQMANSLLETSLTKRLENLMNHLDDFFPEEKPLLLHGDLWSGNYMVGPKGEPSIIDPAVYYGHRYMDLGMMQLFGGFDRAIFDAYVAQAALDSSWRDGAEVANLYPLLVHVNLFGSGYVSQVASIVNRYS